MNVLEARNELNHPHGVTTLVEAQSQKFQPEEKDQCCQDCLLPISPT